MSNITRRVQPTVPTAYDAEDHERAAAIRQLIDAFSALLKRSPNTELDRFYNAEGQRIDGEVGLEERLAENIQSLLEAEKVILHKLDACNGKLATDDHAEPLPCVIALAMCNVIKKFLDNKQIVHGALDVMYRIWTAKILGGMEDTKYIKDFEFSVTMSVCAGLMRWGNTWLTESDSAGVFAGKMCIGLDRVSQVNLDTFLETARQIMESTELVDAPEVLRCAGHLPKVSGADWN